MIDEPSEDIKRLNWLEENKAEILVLYDNVYNTNEERHYAIAWDELKKEVTGKNLRETIDKAMNYV